MARYIGEDIGGYRVIERIGSGGMAKVVKAYQPAFDRFVALKILPEHYAEDQTYLERFQHEAKIIANLEHRHILPVYDFGEDRGITYLAMRYLRAGTLKDVLLNAPGRRLPFGDAARITSQIASALDYAHGQGIVHRDVKPSNILIDAHGDAFLMDFGIAKVLEGTSHLTATGGILGTPAYMSPEQGAGRPVDARSDVYSLGVIVYQMFTGRVPFEADTPLAIVLAHTKEPLPLPSDVNPDIPEEVERVIFRALAKEPDNRYPSAGALAVMLEDAISTMGAAAGTVNASETLVGLSSELAATRPADEVTQDIRRAAARPDRSKGRISPLLVGGVGIVIVVLLVGLTLVLRNLNASNQVAQGAQLTASALEAATLDPEQAFAVAAGATQTRAAEVSMTETAQSEEVHPQSSPTTAEGITPSATIVPTLNPMDYDCPEGSTIVYQWDFEDPTNTEFDEEFSVVSYDGSQVLEISSGESLPVAPQVFKDLQVTFRAYAEADNWSYDFRRIPDQGIGYRLIGTGQSALLQEDNLDSPLYYGSFINNGEWHEYLITWDNDTTVTVHVDGNFEFTFSDHAVIRSGEIWISTDPDSDSKVYIDDLVICGREATLLDAVLPAPMPYGSQIIASQVDEDRELVRVSPGEEPAILTDNHAFDGHVAVSPDGTRVAFWSDRNGGSDVYVMHVDGTNTVQITSNGASNDPSWTTDGNCLIYVSYDGPGKSSIMLFDFLTALSTRIQSFPYGISVPELTADGLNIVFMRQPTEGPWWSGDLYTMPLSGGDAVLLSNGQTMIGQGEFPWPTYFMSLTHYADNASN